MDFDDVVKKVGVKMNEVRDVFMDFTEKAGKKAGEVYGDAKIKIKLADIQRDINTLYKEIGAAAYTAIRAGEDVNAVIGEKCDRVQQLYAEMEEVSKNLNKQPQEEDVDDDDDVIITEPVEEEPAPVPEDTETVE